MNSSDSAGEAVEGDRLEQGLEFAQGFHEHGRRGDTFLDGFSLFPVEILHLIRQHDARSVRVVADEDFEGIAFPLAGHGAAEHESAGPVVARW